MLYHTKNSSNSWYWFCIVQLNSWYCTIPWIDWFLVSIHDASNWFSVFSIPSHDMTIGILVVFIFQRYSSSMQDIQIREQFKSYNSWYHDAQFMIKYLKADILILYAKMSISMDSWYSWVLGLYKSHEISDIVFCILYCIVDSPYNH